MRSRGEPRGSVSDRIGSGTPGVNVQGVIHGNLVPPDRDKGFRPIVPPRGGLEISSWSLDPTPAERRARLFAYTSTDQDVAETVRIEQAETKDGITFALREV